MECKLLFKVATRHRPHLIIRLLENFFANVSCPKHTMLLLSLDLDDSTMCNKQMLDRLSVISKNNNLMFFIDKSKSKVDALNRDIDKIKFDWDAIINITEYCDMLKGFDDAIRSLEKLGYGRLKNKIVYVNSNNTNGKKHKKLYIMGKNIYKVRGYMYNPKFYGTLYKDELLNVCSNIYTSAVKKDVFNYRHSDWFYYATDTITKNKFKHWQSDLETLENLINES